MSLKTPPVAPPTPVSYGLLQNGSKWTFVSGGQRTTYVLDLDAHHPELTPGSWVRLLNPATGKYAHVTCFWLTQGPIDGRTYWEPPSEPMRAAA